MIRTKDNLQLHTKSWTVQQPKAVIVLSHGFGEHIERYAHVAEALNNAGYSVHGLDHRGHGQSEGQPRAFVRSIEEYVDDLKLLWDQVKSPHVPNILIGHSMGGIIAVRYALKYQSELHALVTSGAALIPAPVPSFVRALIRSVAGAMPQFGAIAVPAHYISTDPAEVSKYESDPLIYHGKVPLGTLSAMVSDGGNTLERASELRLPLLVMQGTADKVISPTGSQALDERAGSADKTLKMYPGFFHEIFNEKDRQRVISDMIAWLDKHV
jgi:alpha-beta hydrolase superfamily lysophospholipase